MIDSGGGAICNQVSRVLKQGGKVVCYGMTQGGDVSLGMGFVLKNQEFLGSTMGSRSEFEEMVKFVGEKKVRVVVDRVLDGLDRAEEGFELMKGGGQFGKVSSGVVGLRQGYQIEGLSLGGADFSVGWRRLRSRSTRARRATNSEHRPQKGVLPEVLSSSGVNRLSSTCHL